jgi:hypothetical protein
MSGERTFEEGFHDGWESVAGDEFAPPETVYPPDGEPRDYHAGFRYGRSEAATRFKPGLRPEPL